MHILIPYAAAPGPRCQQGIATLQLPQLARVLQYLEAVPVAQGSAAALTPLHEHVEARALGLRGGDGLLPWAAQDAERLGLTTLHGKDGWAWITPCHWTVHADHVAMADPRQLAMTTKDYETLWHAMQPYFLEDGITLFAHPLGHSPVRWLAHGPVFRDLPTASLDRVADAQVDAWMPRQAEAKRLRRLQNEMQMLLYTHPLNDSRAAYKLAAINSFWVSGTGTLDTVPATSGLPTAACTVRPALRTAALKDDAAGWALAWQGLDSQDMGQAVDLARSGAAVHITLCGENCAVTLAQRPTTVWARLQRRLFPPTVQQILASL